MRQPISMCRCHKAVRIMVVVLCACTPGKGKADDKGFDLDQLIYESRQPDTTLKYQAEQSVFAASVSTNVMARFRVQYSYPYKKRERIDGTPETRVTFFEDGKYLWTYVPSRNVVFKKPLQSDTSPLPAHFYQDIERIKKNYQVMKRGPLPSSNVTCQVLEFLPRKNDRPRKEIWFEKERKIPIRIYISTREGRPAYITELDNLEWNPQIDEQSVRLRVPQGTKVYEIIERGNLTPAQAQRLLQHPILLPARLPSGFYLFDILFRAKGEHKWVQVVYSDGLSSFSIFQEQITPTSEKGEGKSTRPSVPILPEGASIRQYGLLNILTCDLEDIRATLLGEVNEDELLDIARSFSSSK